MNSNEERQALAVAAAALSSIIRSPVLVEGNASSRTVVLNRPSFLNAINIWLSIWFVLQLDRFPLHEFPYSAPVSNLIDSLFCVAAWVRNRCSLGSQIYRPLSIFFFLDEFKRRTTSLGSSSSSSLLDHSLTGDPDSVRSTGAIFTIPRLLFLQQRQTVNDNTSNRFMFCFINKESKPTSYYQ
ncbi:hypothetical protein LXL04_008239 [Taraxacum kok-saghyz]